MKLVVVYVHAGLSGDGGAKMDCILLDFRSMLEK